MGVSVGWSIRSKRMPPMAHGFWASVKGCAMCNYDDNCGGLVDWGSLYNFSRKVSVW